MDIIFSDDLAILKFDDCFSRVVTLKRSHYRELVTKLKEKWGMDITKYEQKKTNYEQHTNKKYNCPDCKNCKNYEPVKPKEDLYKICAFTWKEASYKQYRATSPMIPLCDKLFTLSEAQKLQQHLIEDCGMKNIHCINMSKDKTHVDGLYDIDQ